MGPFGFAWIHPAILHGNHVVFFFYCQPGFMMSTVYQMPMDRFERAEYWWARVARIYPLYLGCLAVTAIWIAKATPTQIVLSMLLLQSWVPEYPLTLNQPGRSLSVEALFSTPFSHSWLAR